MKVIIALLIAVSTTFHWGFGPAHDRIIFGTRVDTYLTWVIYVLMTFIGTLVSHIVPRMLERDWPLLVKLTEFIHFTFTVYLMFTGIDMMFTIGLGFFVIGYFLY